MITWAACGLRISQSILRGGSSDFDTPSIATVDTMADDITTI